MGPISNTNLENKEVQKRRIESRAFSITAPLLHSAFCLVVVALRFSLLLQPSLPGLPDAGPRQVAWPVLCTARSACAPFCFMGGIGSLCGADTAWRHTDAVGPSTAVTKWMRPRKKLNQEKHALNGNRPYRRTNGLAGGPTEVVLTISNVTSATAHVEAIAEHARNGIHAIIETDLSEQRARQLQSLLRSTAAGTQYALVTGETPEIPGRYRRCVAMVAGPAVGAKLVRAPIPETQSPKTWESEGRIALFGCPLVGERAHRSDSGTVLVFFVCVYCPTDGPQQKEAVLESAEQLVGLIGDSPAFIVGGFNCTVEESAVLGRWHGSGELVDLHFEWARRNGVQPEPTTHHTYRSGRRIDYAWANGSACSLVSDFAVIKDAFPTHHTLQVKLKVATAQQWGWRRCQPPALDLTRRRKATPEILRAVKQRTMGQWQVAADKALGQDATSEEKQVALGAMYEIWSRWGEEILHYEAWHHGLPPPARRGRLQPIRYMPKTQPFNASHTCGLASDRCASAVRIAKCVRTIEVIRAMPPGRQEGQKERTWANLRKKIHGALRNTGRYWAGTIYEPLPQDEQLAELQAELEVALDAVRTRIRLKTLKRWRNKMRTNKAYAWVRGESKRAVNKLVNLGNDEDLSNLTHDPQRIDEAIREYWGQVGAPQHAQPALQDALLGALPQAPPAPEQDVVASDIKMALKDANGCRGPDGWSPAELRRLECLHEDLATFFNVMEQAGVVPEVFCDGDTTLIPKKSGGDAPSKMRPITVLATGYRVYSSARFRGSLAEWQEQTYGEAPLAGNRLGHEARDLIVPLTILCEQQAWDGGPPVDGAAYDIAKAFDSLPTAGRDALMWKLARRAGFPPRVLRLLISRCSMAQRRFKLDDWLGEPQALGQLRGVAQGCSLSAVLMTVCTLYWWAWVRDGIRCTPPQWSAVVTAAKEAVSQDLTDNELALLRVAATPSLHAGAYLDDIHLASQSQNEIMRGHIITAVWAKALSVTISTDKSERWGDTPLRLQDTLLQKTGEICILGEEVPRVGVRTNSTLDQRVDKCLDRLKRIARIPGSKERRLKLAQQSALTTLYGMDLRALPKRAGLKIRLATWSAAVKGRRFEESIAPEIIFTVACKGHLVDPAQASKYNLIRLLTRIWHVDKPWCAALTDLWQRHGAHAGRHPDGLLAQIQRALGEATWTWVPEEGIRTSTGQLRPLGPEGASAILHDYRDALRAAEMRKLVSGTTRGSAHRGARAEFAGAELGVDWATTRSLLPEMKLLPQGVLINILAGSFYGRGRMYRHSRGAHAPHCLAPTCRGANVIDDAIHCFWECPYYEALRPAAMLDMRENLNAMPSCAKRCGVATPTTPAVGMRGVQLGMTAIALERYHHGPPLGSPNQPPDEGGAPPPGEPGERWWAREHEEEEQEQDDDEEVRRHPEDCLRRTSQSSAGQGHARGGGAGPPYMPVHPTLPLHPLAHANQQARPNPPARVPRNRPRTQSGDGQPGTLWQERRPPDKVTVAGGRIRCARCQANALMGCSGVRRFHERGCLYCPPGMDPRAVSATRGLWERNHEAIKKQAQSVAEKHGQELQWGGHRYGVLRCRVCEWRTVMGRTVQWDMIPQCTGNKNKSDKNKEKLVAWMRRKQEAEMNWEPSRRHQWRVAGYVVYCATCFALVLRPPQNNSQVSYKQCGEEITIAMAPWRQIWQAVEIPPGQRTPMFDGVRMPELL